jgi:hypothetical protein
MRRTRAYVYEAYVCRRTSMRRTSVGVRLSVACKAYPHSLRRLPHCRSLQRVRPQTAPVPSSLAHGARAPSSAPPSGGRRRVARWRRRPRWPGGAPCGPARRLRRCGGGGGQSTAAAGDTERPGRLRQSTAAARVAGRATGRRPSAPRQRGLDGRYTPQLHGQRGSGAAGERGSGAAGQRGSGAAGQRGSGLHG